VEITLNSIYNAYDNTTYAKNTNDEAGKNSNISRL
jgi:hypothetical protein